MRYAPNREAPSLEVAAGVRTETITDPEGASQP